MEITPIATLQSNSAEARARLAALCPYPLDSAEAATWFACLGTGEEVPA